MDASLSAFLGWAAPILASVLICFGQAMVNLGQRKISERMDSDKKATEEKREAEAKWRDGMTKHMAEQDKKMGLMTSSLQSTMRATLIHNAEKYFSRGSITPEEHASWCDMHDRYSAMGFNGLIDTYRTKIDQLPHVTIEALMDESNI